MAKTNKSVDHIKKKETLERELLENKKSLHNGYSIIGTLLSLTAITETLVYFSDNPTTLEVATPVISLATAIGFIIPTTINLWKVETAKLELKKITTPLLDKASQSNKKTLKKDHDLRPVRQPYRVQ